jgi:hypothetical protein
MLLLGVRGKLDAGESSVGRRVGSCGFGKTIARGDIAADGRLAWYMRVEKRKENEGEFVVEKVTVREENA